jgi:DNA-binding transcriptional ArsR family regulator
MSFNRRVTERRRLDILLLLAESPEYETSQMMIYQALPVASSADAISADLAWLEEQGLVTLHNVSSITLARITQRGLDVAQGRSRCPGVAKPLPEDG